MDEALLTVDAIDIGRFPAPPKKNDVRRGLGVPAEAVKKETVEMGRNAPSPLDEGGARVLLAAAENGRVMVPVAM